MTETDLKHAREHQFIEQTALHLEAVGLPRITGRILGLLMICDPAHQSSADIADALGASKGSVSTCTRNLLQLRLIEKVPVKGSRMTYFRMREDAWSEHMHADLARLVLMRELIEQGLEILKDDPPDRRKRLEEAHELYTFFERELPKLIERFEAEREESK